MKISVKAGGISVAMFAAAAFLLLLAIIMLSVAIAYFMHLIFGLDLAWCFLIVFGPYVAARRPAGVSSASQGQAGQRPRARDRAGQGDQERLSRG